MDQNMFQRVCYNAHPKGDGPVRVHPYQQFCKTIGNPQYAGLAVILICYAIYLHSYFVPLFLASDPNTYHVAARTFRETGWIAQVPPDDFAYISRMWVVNRRGEYYPKYPPFYPMVAGTVSRIFGPLAGLYVNPVCSWLALLGLYILARQLGFKTGALLATFSLAVNPVFNFFALRQDSHPSSIACLVWGYSCFLKGVTEERLGRKRSLIIVGGFLTAFSVGIRYTDVLMALPLLYLASRELFQSRPVILRSYLVGYVIPVALLMIYHWYAFGAPWRTGYALTGEQAGFSLIYLRNNLRSYLTGILNVGLGPVAFLSLFGFVLLWFRSKIRFVFFALWVIPTTCLYSFYYWAPEPRPVAFLRFLLPVIIGFLLVAAGFIEQLIDTFKLRHGWLCAAIFLGVVGAWGIPITKDNSESFRLHQVRTLHMIDTIRSIVPQGSTIISYEAALSFLDLRGEYRLYLEDLFFADRLEDILRGSLKPGPSEYQRERLQRLATNLGDPSKPEYGQRIRDLLARVSGAGKSVYVVADPDNANLFRLLYQRFVEIQTVPEWNRALSQPPLAAGVNNAGDNANSRSGAEQWQREILIVRYPRPAGFSVAEEILLLRAELQLTLGKLEHSRSARDFSHACSLQQQISDLQRSR